MDFIDGTMYFRQDGAWKPLISLYNGNAHVEGLQSSITGQYSHAEGFSTKAKPDTCLFAEIKDVKPKLEISTEISGCNSAIEELQVQIAALSSQVGELSDTVKELSEEMDKLNKRDMFDSYFGIDYSKGKAF